MEFHEIYYNGKYGTLFELRDSIRKCAPKNLLSLNCYTLGEFSQEKDDVQLLNENKNKLLKKGVSEFIIKDAIKKITFKLNS